MQALVLGADCFFDSGVPPAVPFWTPASYILRKAELLFPPSGGSSLNELLLR